MPRIRSIHPEACTSEKLAHTSGNAERCYWRLQTHCDDAGRCEDHPRLIWAALFPLHDDVLPRDVDEWLAELDKVGLIVRYEVEGRSFLEVVAFTEKQKPRHPSPSKIPDPPEPRGSSTADRRNGTAERDETPEGDGGVGVGEGVGSPQPAAEPYTSDFEAWWSGYPRKTDKADARKHYQARRRQGIPHERLIEARDAYLAAQAAAGIEPGYLKYGATFLSGPDGSWSEYLDLKPATIDFDPVPSTPNGKRCPRCIEDNGWYLTETGMAVCDHQGADADV